MSIIVGMSMVTLISKMIKMTKEKMIMIKRGISGKGALSAIQNHNDNDNHNDHEDNDDHDDHDDYDDHDLADHLHVVERVRDPVLRHRAHQVEGVRLRPNLDLAVM